MATTPRSIEPAPIQGMTEGVTDVGRLPARQHVLDLDDFTPDEIEQVLHTTEAMKEVLGRDIKKVPPLRGKVVMTLFYEARTRTRISFEEAGKVLSAEVINMSGSGSSVEKGESLLNTALTLQAMGANIIVMRHPHSGAPNFVARSLQSVSIINAGDGLHAHPTQALLDLYTIKEKLGRIAGLKIVIVGDVLHSRVARSNLWGMTSMGAQVTLCGPPTLLPQEMLRPRPHQRRWAAAASASGYRLGPRLGWGRRGDGPATPRGTPRGWVPAQPAGVHPPLAGQPAAP